MALIVGGVSVNSGYLKNPVAAASGSPFMSNGRPNGAESTASQYTYWAYPGNVDNNMGGGWRYRTILTHGYIAAGYKGSNPWRSVNKTWHQTDITVYCGEQIDRPVAYVDGTFSDLNAYVHGTGGFSTASTYTSSYSMFNGIMRQALSRAFSMFGSGTAPYGYESYDPKNEGLNYGDQTNLAGHGGWDMNVSRSNHGCASTQIYGAGYVFGGSTTTTNKLHFPSEVMYTTTASPVTWGATDAIGGETRAYILGNSTNSACYYMSLTTDAFTSWGFNSGTSDGNNKSLMSKHGHFYAGVGGNTDTRRWKFNDSTGAYISQLSKLSNFGEENQQMGQDWGYMVGNYNGQQNNWTTKTTYSTDAEVTLGFAAQPKGHYGTSSGCCSSAAASIVAVLRQ